MNDAVPETGQPGLPETEWIEHFFDSRVDEPDYLEEVLKIPAVNVYETEQAFWLEMGVPGLKKEDFIVGLEGKELSIGADKQIEEPGEGRYNRREYNYSSWLRSFELPEDVQADLISAEYKDGELRVKIPKSKTGETVPVKSITVN